MVNEDIPRPEPKGPVPGEVVAREDAGSRVRLDTGETGFLLEGPLETALTVGERAVFRIEHRDTDGRLVLTVVPSEDSTASQAFDQAVYQLHNALANHRPSNTYQKVEHDPLGEEQIEQWIGHVEQTLVRLRERRTRRLNEQL
jgi:hypothetical protein